MRRTEGLHLNLHLLQILVRAQALHQVRHLHLHHLLLLEIILLVTTLLETARLEIILLEIVLLRVLDQIVLVEVTAQDQTLVSRILAKVLGAPSHLARVRVL